MLPLIVVVFPLSFSLFSTLSVFSCRLPRIARFIKEPSICVVVAIVISHTKYKVWILARKSSRTHIVTLSNVHNSYRMTRNLTVKIRFPFVSYMTMSAKCEIFQRKAFKPVASTHKRIQIQIKTKSWKSPAWTGYFDRPVEFSIQMCRYWTYRHSGNFNELQNTRITRSYKTKTKKTMSNKLWIIIMMRIVATAATA